MQGRCDDVLALSAREGAVVKLLPLALATVLEDEAHVHDFQLVQTGPRRLLLRLAVAERPRADGACAALRDYLRRHDLASVRLVLDAGAPQRDAASGKLRRVVNAAPAAG